jgi:hypothetical protein
VYFLNENKLHGENNVAIEGNWFGLIRIDLQHEWIDFVIPEGAQAIDGDIPHL